MTETDWGALRAQRRALARTIDELGALDDEISREVQAVVGLLVDMKFGFRLEHVYFKESSEEDEEEDDGDDERRESRAMFYKSLAWAKVERKRWTLVHREWDTENPGPVVEKEFKACSRDVRLKVARHLPELVKLIFGKLAESLAERKAVLANLGELKSVLGDE